jgi:Tannase and feruloyl esterase
MRPLPAVAATGVRSALSVASWLAVAACTTTGASRQVPADPAAACAALAAPIDATSIALPTRGASIDSATYVAASAEAATHPLPFVPPPPEAVIVPAMPGHCRVLGRVAPVDPAAPPIRFAVNLPDDWSGRYLQLGGGGFNGVLIDGLALPPSARIDKPGPLMRGFVTAGTDSGHAAAPGVSPQAFALNDEALENFSNASYKKVRDVAVALIKRRYGKGPDKLYYMGSSEGGREALTMAQRYPADFDGIFARAPVINFVGLQLAGTRMGTTQMGAGWLSPAHVQLVHDAVLKQCDGLDGLADGVISDYEGCRRVFDISVLRCPAGGMASTSCLVDAQVDAVRTLHSPYTFDIALANGVRAYPGWGYGGESATGTGPVGGYVSWMTGTTPQTLPAGPASSRAWLYGSGTVQYLLMRSPGGDPRNFQPSAHAEQVRRISALMDSTDPDLSAFARRGGKLVLSEHMADYAQSPYAGIEYWKSVVEKLGRTSTDDFMRLYVTPGADHVGTGAPTMVDMLDVLMAWVERGQAPGDLVQVSLQNAPPHAETLSRPMCRYPTFPRYVGNGADDTKSAASFRCVAPGAS